MMKWLTLPWLLSFARYCTGISSNFTDSYGLLWVPAKLSNESQFEACRRLHAWPVPSDFNYPMAWNSTVVESVAQGLNCFDDISLMLKDCCVPSLWVDMETGNCFTHSFGSAFVNYGSYDQAARPVYSCLRSLPAIIHVKELHLTDPRVSSSGVVTVGMSDTNLLGNSQISIDAVACDNVDSCEMVCKTCSDSSSCPANSACLKAGSDPVCFQYCSGLDDLSCPCGTLCDKVNVNIGQSSVSTYLCTPKLFSTAGSDVCGEHLKTMPASSFQCTKRDLTNKTFGSVISTSISVGFSGSVANSVVPSHAPSCSSIEECYDGNICTKDSIDRVYQPVVGSGCKSVLQATRERQTPYSYIPFISTGEATSQSAFLDLFESGSVSEVSSVDDYPLDRIDLSFALPYFGNLVKSIALNPNGVIHLPPIPKCTDVINSPECPAFSTGSNIISLWSNDWNLRSGGYVKYFFGSTSSGIPNINILYKDVVKFGTTDGRLNTFSVSIFQDGSMRLRYHDVNSAVSYGNLFGIWGSYASSQLQAGTSLRDSPPGSFHSLRYHQENISSSLIATGTDLVFCYQNSIACVEEACVYPGMVLTIHWSGVSDTCAAFGEGVERNIVCSFVGGLVSSPATVSNQTISCVVPTIPYLPTNRTISLDIVISFAPTMFDSLVTIPGSHHVYAVTRGYNLEVARHGLSLNYFSSSSHAETDCGCSALLDYRGFACTEQSFMCDSPNRTDGAVEIQDCFGTPFGSAFVDTCNICAGGMSGVIPQASCVSSPPKSSSGLRFFTETILLISLVCCMSFFLSSMSYIVRGALMRRGLINQAPDFDLDLNRIMLVDLQSSVPQSRGLNEFEKEALGQFVFNDELAAKMAGVNSTKDEEHGNIGSTECSICLVDLEKGNNCRVLPDPCGHIFHLQCIDEWFQQSIFCPLCKRSIRDILEGGDGILPERPAREWTGADRDRYVAPTRAIPSTGEPPAPLPPSGPSSSSSIRQLPSSEFVNAGERLSPQELDPLNSDGCAQARRPHPSEDPPTLSLSNLLSAIRLRNDDRRPNNNASNNSSSSLFSTGEPSPRHILDFIPNTQNESIYHIDSQHSIEDEEAVMRSRRSSFADRDGYHHPINSPNIVDMAEESKRSSSWESEEES